MTFSTRGKTALGVCAVLAAVALGCWIYQLAGGLGVTGMNNSTSWGAYIMMFMFMVGLSAGGLIVASSASVFHIERYERVAIPAIICSLVCICLAGAFILIDLGGIQRIWRMLTGPNFASPLVWDMCVITLYLVINILDLRFLVRGDHRAVEILSRFALPCAILVHSVTAWIFGLQIAREGWHSAIMAPIFVASACDSGLALLLVSLIGLQKAKLFDAGDKLIANLAGLLAVFVSVDAFFIGCELLTTAYSGTDAGNFVLGQMFSGATAPFFWFEMVCGLLIPFLILVFAKNRSRKGMVLAASILVVLGVLCKRAWLLFTSFLMPNVYGGPGITLGTKSAQADPAAVWSAMGVYAPTPVEVAIIVGALAGGFAIWLLLSKRFLPAWEPAREA
ncbi:NrfD/PsrC family molybdoenzyme membrane anchor subunit [Curtanaerobium respiraculi]|uniref:NrfD/PsrC family molybdoenzyme membrane anchor subunit n=1 Tax=Curtanaerobium respiraculi TaxID=2949669 RepID=UPI0024B347B3|nr:NrfD/PsrC family molybdoenzyme membrane anchor subunit [Curtanaerobium respiraculi]